MSDIEKESANEVIENNEEAGLLNDTPVEETGFEVFDLTEEFFLSDEPEKKKSGVPIVGIIAIVVALAIAVGVFLIVRHKNNVETILISNPDESVSAEVRDGELYINDNKIDPEDIGIDPEDEDQLEKYASSLNKGNVTLPNKVARQITNKNNGNSSSGNASSGNSSSGGSHASSTNAASTSTTRSGRAIKPSYIYASVPASEYEVGHSGKVSVVFGPVYSTEKAVTYSSSDASVIRVDHLGNFRTVGLGTATITVQSKVTPSAKDTVTIKVVDVTTTKTYKITTTTTTTTTTLATTTTTKPTTAPHPSDPIYIQAMRFSRTSGIDGSYNASLKKGGSVRLDISFTPSTANNSDVTFYSSDPSVCSVNSSGIVTAKSAGSATVTVTPKKGSAGSIVAHITVTE